MYRTICAASPKGWRWNDRRSGPAPFTGKSAALRGPASSRRPGYHTIYNVIRAIPDDLKTLALGGEKAYREAYDLVHRREAERPN